MSLNVYRLNQRTSDGPRIMPTQTMFSVPYPRDKKFVGRQSVFDEMEYRLRTEHCVSLLGMGGVGYLLHITGSAVTSTNISTGRKSQIAIEYAYRTRNWYPHRHIFWVYAANSTRFDQAYQEIARHLKLDGYNDPKVDTGHLVYEWLNAENHAEWLMIVDNADDANLFMHQSDQDSAIGQIESATVDPLANRVPRRLNSKKLLIVTTRNRSIGEDLINGGPCLEVGPFSVEEAQHLLRSKARGVMDQSDTLKSEELVEILGGIPLAITQAAAFMVRNRFKVEQYLAALEKDERTRMDFLSTDLQDSRRERGTPNSVFRTWSLSFEQIRKQAPRAAQLLSLMAMLDSERVPDDLLLEQDEKEVDFATDIGTLIDYSLITKEVGEETCAMLPLVQLSVQYWLGRERQTAYFRGRALQVLAKKFPNGEHENRRLCEELLPHARASLKQAIEEKDDQLHRAKLLHHVGWFDWRQGRYELAYENVSAAYNARREMFGAEDSGTLNCVSLLGAVLADQGKYKAAEAMNRRALAGREKVLGAEHPDTLTSVYCLAYLFHAQHRFAQADELYQRALSGYGMVLDAGHRTTATCQSHYSSILREWNRGSS